MRTKVKVEIDKIHNFRRISCGRGSPSYQSDVSFSYDNKAYQKQDSINALDYKQRKQLHKSPNQLVIFYSPVSQQVFSQRALVYNRYQNKNSIYLTLIMVIFCLGLVLHLMFYK